MTDPTPQQEVPRRLLSAALWAGLVVTALVMASLGKGFFIPLVMAFIAVYFIKALSTLIGSIHIGRFRLPDAVAALLSYCAIVGIAYVFIGIIADNAFAVAAEAPKYQARLISLQADFFNRFDLEQPAGFRQFIRNIDLPSLLTAIATNLAGLLGQVALIFIYGIFILLEIRFLPAKLASLFPDEVRRERVQQILRRIHQDIHTYVGVKTLISLTTGLLSYLVMWLVGLDFAAFWALLIFILNYIPTFGSIIATIFPAMLALLQFENLRVFLIVAIGITAIQQVLGSIIEPNLMGRSLNLSPLVVIMSLILWGMLWGVVGMFVCVPITVVILIVLSNFDSTRWVAVLLSKSGSVRGAGPV